MKVLGPRKCVGGVDGHETRMIHCTIEHARTMKQTYLNFEDEIIFSSTILSMVKTYSCYP